MRKIWILLAASAAIMMTSCMNAGTQSSSEPEPDIASLENIPIQPVDADEYYSEWGKITEKYKAADSDKMLSEKAAAELFASRGFSTDEIMTEYSGAGVYSEGTVIKAASNTKHPVYYMLYTTEKGIVWNISLVENALIADPVMQNLEKKVPVVYSDASYMTGYDSATNQFYHIQTDQKKFKLITVDGLNKKALDSITEEDMK